MEINDIRSRLSDKKLRITPQRMSVFEAILTLNNHPTAENIIDFVRNNHPNISTATVYKVLDTLVEHGLIRKVKTERDIMRYDAFLENHHHLYSSETDRIEDYVDNELTELIEKHFEKKGIAGFNIEDIKLQIIGKFTDSYGA